MALPESSSKFRLFRIWNRNAYFYLAVSFQISHYKSFQNLSHKFLSVHSYLILLKCSFLPHMWAIFSCYHRFYICYRHWMKRRDVNTLVYCKLQINTLLTHLWSPFVGQFGDCIILKLSHETVVYMIKILWPWMYKYVPYLTAT